MVQDFAFAHQAAGWEEFQQRIKDYGSVAVAIETSQGAVVAQLVRLGVRGVSGAT